MATGIKVINKTLQKLICNLVLSISDCTKLVEIPFPSPSYRHQALDLMT